MSESDPNKKDMTHLMDLLQSMQQSGDAPAMPEGFVMEEQKIEKLDQFESLEDFGKANPAPEPPAFDAPPFAPPPAEVAPPAAQDDFAISEPPPPVEPPPSLSGDFAPAEGFPADGDFAVTSDAGANSDFANADFAPPPPPSENAACTPQNSDFPATPLSIPESTPASAPTDEPDASASSAIPDFAEQEPLSPELEAALAAPVPPLDPPQDLPQVLPPPLTEPMHHSLTSANGAPTFSTVSVSPSDMPGSGTSSAVPPPLEPQEPLRPARKATPPTLEPLEKVRQYSEQLAPSKNNVPAAFPFSLVITGALAPEEKERLTDLLARENMGIREMDLEPQFQEGKILIPRISEYAGVLIVSALRSARVKMRLGPSDQIYASVDTRDSDEETPDRHEGESEAFTSDIVHSAEEMPITTETQIPGAVQVAVLDIVTASAALKTMVVQAETSLEYHKLLEALQRELKYKAYAKGATAVTCFSVHLTQLHMPMHYRVLVTGSAVRTTEPSKKN